MLGIWQRRKIKQKKFLKSYIADKNIIPLRQSPDFR